MAPIDLLNTALPQTFRVSCIIIIHNDAKNQSLLLKEVWSMSVLTSHELREISFSLHSDALYGEEVNTITLLIFL